MRTTTLLLLLAILATTIHAVKVNKKAGFLRSASITMNAYFSQTLTSGTSYVIKNFNTNNYLTMVASDSGFKIKPSSDSGTTFEYTENSDGTGYLTTYTYSDICVWRNGSNAGLDICVLNTDYVEYAGCALYGDGQYDTCSDVKINIINSGVESGNSSYYGDFYLQADDGSGVYLQESSNTYSPSTTRNQKWLFFEVVSS